MSLDVTQAIARVPQWAGVDDIEVTPLGGGITNQNFRVEVGGESFVLRLAGEDTERLGIQRQNEHAANLAAARVGIAPEVLYFMEPEGYLVTRFIDGKPIPVDEMGSSENIRRVAEALLKVHSMGPIPGLFSASRVVNAYTELGRRQGAAFPENFEWLLDRKREIEGAQQRGTILPRPCHNDLLNGNFLDDGAIRILDWEYAGMGDVFFDLANFAVNHEFSDDQDRYLLESYFGEASEPRFARLKQMKVMSDFREAMWGVVQSKLSKLDFDFQGYAGRHFERLTRSMDDPRWGKWHQEVIEHG
ncbi:MAG TPA: choline/ethanolamine kinase family protein [Anaerolineales bacterium]|nr:choline/ethanolamine kinase family protein [Anaerolineales bacterium]